MSNYFNQLALRQQLDQLGQCRFMDLSEFDEGIQALEGKKIVIVGCGAQGLNQGLNMRDSGLQIAYALRAGAIEQKRASYQNATSNNFEVGTYEALIPQADVVINLTPDKNHSSVVEAVMPLMKQGATLSYSHGFNIVEEGMQIRKDLTVIMVAPKCPGSEVREEYKRGFGVPTLIAVHPENDPQGHGLAQAKAYAFATGGHRAGVLESSFVAEVKSDLMGEQTILCGVLQTGSILSFDKMVEEGIEPGYAAKLIQYGWETITEALKHGGITNMMDRLSNPAKIKAFELSEQLKEILQPLFEKHMDDIMSGHFSKTMMVAAGIKEESAYYESLHETPLIANTIARKKLFEMNRIISDTAEYGCYLFDHAAKPLLADFMKGIKSDVIGAGLANKDQGVDNKQLIDVNEIIRYHPVEMIGYELRASMTAMTKIV
ncbi:MAG: ketol-acid reductoisomerase [Flavobacteriia bacterium]|nr:ketol-acid reductoisomerase [Flavobacteriia bacterium]